MLARARFEQLLAAVSLPDPAAALAEVTRLGCGIWAMDPHLVRNLFALARSQADALPVIGQLEAGRAQIMEHLAGLTWPKGRVDNRSRHHHPIARQRAIGEGCQ